MCVRVFRRLGHVKGQFLALAADGKFQQGIKLVRFFWGLITLPRAIALARQAQFLYHIQRPKNPDNHTVQTAIRASHAEAFSIGRVDDARRARTPVALKQNWEWRVMMVVVMIAAMFRCR